MIKNIFLSLFLLCFAAFPFSANAFLNDGKMQVGDNFWFDAPGMGHSIIKPGVNFSAAWQSGKTGYLINENIWEEQALEDLKNYSVLRFMDWVITNGSQITDWAQVRKPEDALNSDNGWKQISGHTHPPMAHEWMIDLCNRLKTDCWLTVPAHTDVSGDDYWHKMAEVVQENLDPELRVWIEYSNEAWNGSFEQSSYMRQRGAEVGLGGGEWPASFKYYGVASVKLWEAFEDVFGKESPRVVKVMAGQLGHDMISLHFNDVINNAELNPNGTRPDVYAIAPYFARGIVGSAGSEAVISASVDAELALVAQWKQVADANNTPLISYEGGQHIFQGGADVASSQAWMYDIYKKYLDGLSQHLELFTHYTYAGNWGNGGAWGSKNHLNQPLGEAHKFRALQDWMQENGTGNDGAGGNPGGEKNDPDPEEEDEGNEKDPDDEVEEQENEEAEEGEELNPQPRDGGNIPAGACHEILPGGNTPDGFAHPWSLFTQPNPSSSQVVCGNNTVEFEIGSGEGLQLIWHQVFATKDGADWVRDDEGQPRSFPLAGERFSYIDEDEEEIVTDWILSKGTRDFDITNVELANRNYLASYHCNWVPRGDENEGDWKCGCRNADTCDANGLWTIQSFQAAESAGDGGADPVEDDDNGDDQNPDDDNDNAGDDEVDDNDDNQDNNGENLLLTQEYGVESFTPEATKADAFYIAINGNDGAAGTEEAPWATLAHAANTLTAGQTVYIREGNYTLAGKVTPANSGTAGNEITFAAYPGETPVFDASAYRTGSAGFVHDQGAFFINNGTSHIRIEGLTIENSYGSGISVCNGNNITIIGNTIKNTFASGINTNSRHDSGCTSSDINILHNTLTNTNLMAMKYDGYGGSEAPHEAISIMGTTNFEVAHNHIHDTEKEGIDIKEDSKNGEIHNNLVEDIDRQCYYIDAWHGTLSNVEFHHNVGRRCTFMGFAISVENAGAVLDGAKIHHNLLYENGGAGIYFSNFNANGPRRNVEIYNNTVVGNSIHEDHGNWNGGGLCLLSDNVSDITVRDNIFSENIRFQLGANQALGGDAGLAGKNITVQNNLIFGQQNNGLEMYENVTMNSFEGVDTIVADPELSADFLPSENSPVVGAASDGENIGAF